MKVVIACLNSKYVHASLSPWCLLAGIREFSEINCDAVVMESTINGDTEDFARKIIKEKPDVLAFSCYIWNITKTLEICSIIKEKSDCKIILGGPEVAYRSKDILEKYNYIDFVLSGEGEWTFPDFIDNMNSNLSFVSGLAYRENGEIITVPEKEYNDTPPSPYCDEFFESLNGRITYIETARGCPYRCAFCLSGRCSSLRFFDLERVKKDIIRLSQSGTQTVKFVDRTFNANAERANEILLFIKEHYGKEIPWGICFHFEISGDILKESTLEILSSMPVGAVQLEVGMQSFNENTLKLINRKTNTEKLVENIRNLVSFNNMHIHIDLIAGLTGEDIESFKNSFNTGYYLKAHMLQLGFLKLLHGADMRENKEKYPCAFTDVPPYEVTSTPWLSADEIKMLKNCEDAVDRLYNSGRFLLTLEYLTDEVGISPFDIFNDFGNSVNGNKMRLSDYAENLYNFFCDKCDKEILREKLLCDLLCCSSSVEIPEVFKIKDPLYKKIKKYFIENVDNNIKIAILYSTNQVFAVNQSKEKNLHNRYEGEYYNIDF
ncbi:MAG: DUF4080 domain-containing protein [Acutalibacteraceae bacterium]|nr:DUF4080 domain-containing protein [Acutalibacteraceae bacterium]